MFLVLFCTGVQEVIAPDLPISELVHHHKYTLPLGTINGKKSKKVVVRIAVPPPPHDVVGRVKIDYSVVGTGSSRYCREVPIIVPRRPTGRRTSTGEAAINNSSGSNGASFGPIVVNQEVRTCALVGKVHMVLKKADSSLEEGNFEEATHILQRSVRRRRRSSSSSSSSSSSNDSSGGGGKYGTISICDT